LLCIFLGNHEYEIGDADNWFSLMEKYGNILKVYTRLKRVVEALSFV